MNRGTTYIIKCGDFHKIGYTEDLNRRLSDMQGGNPITLSVIHQFETDTPKQAEALLHKIFKNKRINGEWFALTQSDLHFLSSITGYSNGSFEWGDIVKLDDVLISRDAVQLRTVDWQDNTILISEEEIYHFIQTAWRRQCSGKNGLSRRYWTTKGYSRPVYDSIVNLLVDHNLTIRRKRGHSGKLLKPPIESMSIIVDALDPEPMELLL